MSYYLDKAVNMTLKNLAKNIEHYDKLEKEIDRLEASKEIAKQIIVEAFNVGGMRYFDLPSHLRARVKTTTHRTIKYEEARQLLNENTLNKLVHLFADTEITITSIQPDIEDTQE